MTEQEASTTGQERETAAEFQPEAPSEQGFIGEVWGFLAERKLYWLAPIIVAFLLLGLLFVLANSASFMSPFIYAL